MQPHLRTSAGKADRKGILQVPVARPHRHRRECTLLLDLSNASGFYEMKAKRNAVMAEHATFASTPTQRDTMDVRRLMDHPSENIASMTAKMAGIKLTGKWSQCPELDVMKIHDHAVPKKVAPRASTRVTLLHVDLAGPMPATILRGSKYVMTMVGNYSRFKGIKFLKSKDYTTATLQSYIADYTTLAGLTTAVVRTDNGKDFNCTF